MKALIGFVLFLSILELQAAEIKVSKMVKDGQLERSFILKTNLKEKVVIDCQSFIQGLRVGEFDQAFTFLLDEQECDGLQKRINDSLKKHQKHCIDVEDDIRSDRSCI